MNPNVDLVITDMLLVMHGASPRWLKLETPPRHSQGLIYVKSGRAEYRFTDGRRFEVKPGDLFFLHKSSRYQGRQLGEETYTFVYADFETAHPGDLSALGLPDVCPARDPAAALELFSRMAACWLDREPGYRMVCRALLLRLIAMMVRDQSAAALSGARGDRLAAAMRLMRARLDDPSLRVEALAAEAYLSPVQFRRVFREAYGCAPSEYLMRLRLERACDLLRAEGDYSVSETAEMCGFSSLYYFSRAFKKHMGITPGRYRRRLGDV